MSDSKKTKNLDKTSKLKNIFNIILIVILLIATIVLYFFQKQYFQSQNIKDKITVKPSLNLQKTQDQIDNILNTIKQIEQDIANIKNNIQSTHSNDNSIAYSTLALQNIKFKLNLGLPFSEELKKFSSITGKSYTVLEKYANDGVYNLKYLITKYRNISFINNREKTNNTIGKIKGFFCNLINIQKKQHYYDINDPINVYITQGNIGDAIKYMKANLPEETLNKKLIKDWIVKAEKYTQVNKEIKDIENNL